MTTKEVMELASFIFLVIAVIVLLIMYNEKASRYGGLLHHYERNMKALEEQNLMIVDIAGEYPKRAIVISTDNFEKVLKLRDENITKDQDNND